MVRFRFSGRYSSMHSNQPLTRKDAQLRAEQPNMAFPKRRGFHASRPTTDSESDKRTKADTRPTDVLWIGTEVGKQSPCSAGGGPTRRAADPPSCQS